MYPLTDIRDFLQLYKIHDLQPRVCQTTVKLTALEVGLCTRPKPSIDLYVSKSITTYKKENNKTYNKSFPFRA